MLPFLDLSARLKNRFIFFLCVCKSRFRFWIITRSSEEATLKVSCIKTPLTCKQRITEDKLEQLLNMPKLPHKKNSTKHLIRSYQKGGTRANKNLSQAEGGGARSSCHAVESRVRSCLTVSAYDPLGLESPRTGPSPPTPAYPSNPTRSPFYDPHHRTYLHETSQLVTLSALPTAPTKTLFATTPFNCPSMSILPYHPLYCILSRSSMSAVPTRILSP